jgi:hypothetical protein
VIDKQIASLEEGLTKLVLFELYDQKLREDIRFWLAVQGIECLLPDSLNSDWSMDVAIKMEGKIHVLRVPKL